MLKFVANVIGSGFGSGYLPKMPGTWGTIFAFLISWFIEHQFGVQYLLPLTLVSFFVGWGISQYLINLNPTNLDPSYIVIDEFAGSFLLIWLLHGIERLQSNDLMLYGLAFIMFRFFDIIKVSPIGWVEERLSRHQHLAGFAVMIDDILAALYPYLITLIIVQF